MRLFVFISRASTLYCYCTITLPALCNHKRDIACVKTMDSAGRFICKMCPCCQRKIINNRLVLCSLMLSRVSYKPVDFFSNNITSVIVLFFLLSSGMLYFFNQLHCYMQIRSLTFGLYSVKCQITNSLY